MFRSLYREVHPVFQSLHCLVQPALQPRDPIVELVDCLLDIGLSRSKGGFGHKVGQNMLGQRFRMGFRRLAIEPGTLQRLRVG